MTNGTTRLQHLHDTQFYDAEFSRLLVDPRFTDVAAAVLGVPNVQLHHTKLRQAAGERVAIPAASGSPVLPAHISPDRKGCVRVVPGSHLDGPREHDPEGGFHLPDVPFESAVPQPAEAGDVLFFSYLTVHGSGVNMSDEPRTTWLVQFRDPADPPSVRTHDESVMSALRALRMEHAASMLLLGPGTKVAEITRACGYADARAFSTAFRRHHGELPSAFRAGGGTRGLSLDSVREARPGWPGVDAMHHNGVSREGS